MVARAVIVGVVVAGPLVLAACSFTKSDDSPVPAPTTRLVAPTSRASVVGTLPPITTSPTTSVVVPAPPPSSTASTPEPATSSASVPPATAARPATTAGPPATHTGTSLTVQAGAFSTRDAADQAVQALAAKGFGGFAVSGSGPFRVVRGGLSGADADALVRSLAGAGVAAFVRG